MKCYGELYDIVCDRLRRTHVKSFGNWPRPLILISDHYPGAWLEHVYDSVLLAEHMPEFAAVPRSQAECFLRNQKADGQLPCYVLDESNPFSAAYVYLTGFGQIQECLSFGRLCLEIYGDDMTMLPEVYERLCRWDDWLCAHRMTLGQGLIEQFCEFDTGHDNSPRMTGGSCPGNDASVCPPVADRPYFAPDMNAVFYGDRVALAELAERLGRPEEAALWRRKAEDVRQALLRICYDPETDFFYDADRTGKHTGIRSISITQLFQEHVLTQEEAQRIYTRYLRNPDAFWTKAPFASLDIRDPKFVKDKLSSFGYYSQALPVLRARRWMDFYGWSQDYEALLRNWAEGYLAAEDRPFEQEREPFTGEFTSFSPWYSASMLLYLDAVKRLGLN